MNTLLIIYLFLTPIDTIQMKYITTSKDTIWKTGYFIANVTHKEDVYMIFDEPTIWLNDKKQPILRPKKYHLTF